MFDEPWALHIFFFWKFNEDSISIGYYDLIETFSCETRNSTSETPQEQ